MLLKLLALFVLSAHAAFTVQDPDGELAKMNSWVRMPAFETAMTCGQTTMIDFETMSCSVKCDSRWCQSKCETAHDKATAFFGLHIDECSNDMAHVFGDNGLIIDVPKAEYVAGGNSYVIPFLKNIGLFIQPEGNIVIESGFPGQAMMIVGGKMTTLRTYEIRGLIDYGQPQGEHFDLIVTAELPGVQQILKFSMGDDVFFRVRGMIEPNRSPK